MSLDESFKVVFRKGSRVRFNGPDIDRSRLEDCTDPTHLLVPGEVYTVDHAEVEPNHTLLFLEGVKGGVNSIQFTEVQSEDTRVRSKVPVGQEITFTGWLCKINHGDSVDVLSLSCLDEPLLKVLSELITGKMVTVRYWLTTMPCTPEQAESLNARMLLGDSDVEFLPHHSELTGYLYTDERLYIGGHDLLAELENNVGKWLNLNIQVHDQRDGTVKVTFF